MKVLRLEDERNKRRGAAPSEALYSALFSLFSSPDRVTTCDVAAILCRYNKAGHKAHCTRLAAPTRAPGGKTTGKMSNAEPPRAKAAAVLPFRK